jgi:type II secretory ATPase GspE/PulE/Tfp pilus assembly ATPase PilB-like protein
MVGEIRDQETAELAIHAALTGHLIFSTIHTNDAIGVVPRLMDMGAEPFLLSATLNLLVAQRLARKICEHCKEPTDVPADVLEQLRASLRDTPAEYLPPGFDPNGTIPAFKGKGCVRCGEIGYSGRTVIAEMISVTPEIQRLMNNKFPMAEVQAEVKRQGWITMRQDAIIKVIEGLTTVEEVMRVAKV